MLIIQREYGRRRREECRSQQWSSSRQVTLAAGGVPFCAIEFQSKGDAITDIAEDMAAEQKARSTYDNLLRLCRDDPDVYEPLKFLREREVVHFQRFGEAMSIIQSKLDSKNFYAYNPEFKK